MTIYLNLQCVSIFLHLFKSDLPISCLLKSLSTVFKGILSLGYSCLKPTLIEVRLSAECF